MTSDLCPQCNSPLPPVALNRGAGAATVQCGGCGKTVFHPSAAVAGRNDPTEEDDWLSLDSAPIRETVAAVPVADDHPSKDAFGDAFGGEFDEDDSDSDSDSDGDDRDGDDSDFAMAPAKPRPSAEPDDWFDDLDLPDTPPPRWPSSVPEPASSSRPRPPASSSRPRPPGSSGGGRSPRSPGSSGPPTDGGLAMPAAAASRDLLSSSDQNEYRVKCKVCDSVMFVHPKSAGTVIECSDCHTKIRVPPPPKTAGPPKKQQTPVRGSGASPGSRPTGSSAIGDGMSLRGGNLAPRPADPYAKSASDLLDEASKADLEDEEPNYDVPDVFEWAKGVVGIFTDLGVIAHWVIISTLASIAAGVIAMVGHPGLAVLMFPGAGLFGLLTLACAFSILESTANSNDRIENWPSADMSLMMDNAVVTGAAVVISALPLCVLCSLTVGMSMFTVAVTMLSIYALFPFVLLSMLDSGSVFQPFSPEVARSVNKCHESWGGLYFSAAVIFAGLFVLFLIGGSMGPFAGTAVVVFATVAVVFIYFAMIGRLAYSIGQSVRAENARLETE